MEPYVDDIEEATEDNEDFRRVLYTGTHLQLVLMALQPGEAIGETMREDRDQFFCVEAGEGEIVIDGSRHPIETTSPHSFQPARATTCAIPATSPSSCTLSAPRPVSANEVVHRREAQAEAASEGSDGETPA